MMDRSSHRKMQMLAAAAALIGSMDGVHDESRRVPSELLRELKPDPEFGLATEEQKKTKPPKRGKGTRRSRRR